MVEKEDQNFEGTENNTDAKELPSAEEINFGSSLIKGLRVLIVILLLTSIVYPSITTAIGNLVWRNRARGSFVEYQGHDVGSILIGQDFKSEKYFHSRPSSINYDAKYSGSANLSTKNEKLKGRAKSILEELKENGSSPGQVPGSYLSESGSALDPHISPRSAYIQIPRITRSTEISEEKLRGLIEEETKPKLLGMFGAKRVNVLELNIAIQSILDEDQND